MNRAFRAPGRAQRRLRRPAGVRCSTGNPPGDPGGSCRTACAVPLSGAKQPGLLPGEGLCNSCGQTTATCGYRRPLDKLMRHLVGPTRAKIARKRVLDGVPEMRADEDAIHRVVHRLAESCG